MPLIKNSESDTKTVASGVAGFIGGLQNRFFGFDSRRRLQILMYRLRHPFATIRNLRRRQFAWKAFGDAGVEPWRSELKRTAFNKGYEPPHDPGHLAKAIIAHLLLDRDEWRQKAITANKEISRLKRAAQSDI